jgi:colanic acid biosynthesis glycosyl transferase WcaI
MMLDLTFFCFSFFKVLQLLFRQKYDSVITIAPCFQIGLLGSFYKVFRGAKFFYHIQDLQIDAAYELKLIKSRFLIRVLLRIEKFILKNADVVSSISVGMIKKISQKCKREIVLFPNWVDVKSFYPLEQKIHLKNAFHLSPFDKTVLYSGAIGEKQGLENILSVAQELSYIANLKFIICGAGPYKEKLQRKAGDMLLKNVIFLPIQPHEKLNDLLNMADVHLVLQKATAADLVMPSKLTTILSVGGLAIVAASEGTTLHQLVSTNRIGILIDPENKNSLLRAVENVLKNNCEHIKRNARAYAEEFLSVENVLPKYVRHMQS